jgi:hypothetical protein
MDTEAIAIRSLISDQDLLRLADLPPVTFTDAAHRRQVVCTSAKLHVAGVGR